MDENSQKMIVFICEELKKMKNDTDMTCQLYDFEIKNQFLIVCVGKNVDEKSSEVSRHALKVSRVPDIAYRYVEFVTSMGQS